MSRWVEAIPNKTLVNLDKVYKIRLLDATDDTTIRFVFENGMSDTDMTYPTRSEAERALVDWRRRLCSQMDNNTPE